MRGWFVSGGSRRQTWFRRVRQRVRGTGGRQKKKLLVESGSAKTCLYFSANSSFFYIDEIGQIPAWLSHLPCPDTPPITSFRHITSEAPMRGGSGILCHLHLELGNTEPRKKRWDSSCRTCNIKHNHFILKECGSYFFTLGFTSSVVHIKPLNNHPPLFNCIFAARLDPSNLWWDLQSV